MAVEASREAPGGRLVLLTGLTALVVVAAASFGRVYQGRESAVRLGFVALVAMGLAILLENRSLALATIVSAAGLVVAVALLVFPDTTVAGLPTLATFRAAMTAFGSVARTSAVEVAPAPPLPPLLLAGVTASWTAAFATHALAVRARSPLLATAPPAALMVFAGIVMGDGARPLYVFVFLAAGLAVLFADALRRVGAWGPVSVWHERSSVRSGGGTTARGAWRVAIGCLAIALFAPWVLPGFGSTALLSVRGGVAAQVSIDPTVDIRPRLLQNPATQLFTAQSAHASYWRFMTLDTFNGRHWTSSHNLTGGSTPQGNLLPARPLSLPCVDPKTSDPAALRLAPQVCPAGYPDAGPTVYWLAQRFNFGPLAQPWLPAAPDPISASLAGQSYRYDPDTSAIVFPNGSFKGFSYSAVSVAVVPTPAELEAVPSLQVFQNPNWTHYVQLPDHLPPQIGQIANQIVADAGATTPYAKILAIQDYLKDFTYDTHVKAPTGVNDLLYFLTKSHRGYCEQFAGTMAVLLRALGIPARVAVGFTPGTYNSGTKAYQVTTQNAHSWVEVEFPNYGWLAFEPTPTRDNPIAQAYDTNITTGGIQGCTQIGPHGRCLDTSVPNQQGGVNGQLSGPAQKLLHPDLGGPLVAPGTIHAPKPEPFVNRLRHWGLLLGVALLVVLLLATPPLKQIRRHLTLRRGSRDPRARVQAAYEVMCERTADIGLGRRPFETPWEYQRRMAVVAPASAHALDRLTDLTLRATYAMNGITDEDAAEAANLSGDAYREIRRSSPASRRLIGLYRVGSWDPGERWLRSPEDGVRPRAALRA